MRKDEQNDLFADLSQILLYSMRLDNTREVYKDFIFAHIIIVSICYSLKCMILYRGWLNHPKNGENKTKIFILLIII